MGVRVSHAVLSPCSLVEERSITDADGGSSNLSKGTLGVESRGATSDLGSEGGGFDAHHPDRKKGKDDGRRLLLSYGTTFTVGTAGVATQPVKLQRKYARMIRLHLHGP